MPQGPVAVGTDPVFPLNSTLGLAAASTNLIKATAGRIGKICMLTGTGGGQVYDNNSTSTGNTAANQIAALPATAGSVLDLTGWPTKNGIVVVTGTGTTASISWY